MHLAPRIFSNVVWLCLLGPVHFGRMPEGALLEIILSSTTPDEVILAGESHWKNVLLSRQFSYNKN